MARGFAVGLRRGVADSTTVSGIVTVAAVVLGASALVAGLVTSGGGGEAGVVLGPQAPPSAIVEAAPGASPSPRDAIESDLVAVRARVVVDGLREPTGGVAIPGTDSFFVLERSGRVLVVSGGDVRPEPALDVAGAVTTRAYEQGLIGIALHPEWYDNGRVFVSYTDRAGSLTLAEFESDTASLRMDRATERVLLVVEHTADAIYHLGGTMAFGPDGYLWLAVGDGSSPSGADTNHNGPNPFTLPGTLLRLDVGTPGEYAIPSSNPFRDGIGGAPEVWAFGFRNPWAFTFDNGHLIVADVGHDSYEEIDAIPLSRRGGFYGWSWWEGDECRLSIGCDDSAIPPIVVLPHDEVCAIIGGPVYLGRAIPELVGQYLYSDYCSGQIAGIPVEPVLYAGGAPAADGMKLPVVEGISRFVVDSSGEVFVIQFGRGRILKLEPVRLGADVG